MSRFLCAIVLLATVWMMARLHAQEPAFEVASVKPNNSASQAITMDLAGRRLTALNTPLRELIRFAYDVQSDRLLGGPSWLTSERFDVTALADRDLPDWTPAGPPADALRMLRRLLADRFRPGSASGDS